MMSHDIGGDDSNITKNRTFCLNWENLILIFKNLHPYNNLLCFLRLRSSL